MDEDYTDSYASEESSEEAYGIDELPEHRRESTLRYNEPIKFNNEERHHEQDIRAEERENSSSNSSNTSDKEEQKAEKAEVKEEFEDMTNFIDGFENLTKLEDEYEALDKVGAL